VPEAKPTPDRADFILTAAIALVAILVLALVLVLNAGSQIFAESQAARAQLRDLRVALIDFTAAHNDATSAETAFLLTRDIANREAFFAAAAATRRHAAEAERLTASDPPTREIGARLTTTTDTLLLHLEAMMTPNARRPTRDLLADTLKTSIDQDTAALHASIRRRSDVITSDEASARARIDSIASALALLSLVTAALASLALRRERKQWRLATEAAEEARARAAASDLAKTRFLAVASHDMRQPLHALTLYLSALERRVEGAEARDILSKMDRATQSMVGMFSMLLDLARIQAGVVKAEFSVVRLQEIIDRIIAQYPGSAVDAAPTSLSIQTDPLLIERILHNLVSNALRHGGGKARIAVSHERGYAEIAVADDGPGIALEDQERIFEEFVRLEGRAEGLGLGLAIVRRIADILGTPIRIESSPGAGARFILRTPLALPAAPTKAEPEQNHALADAKVLVVDDETLAREAVAGALRDLGADVRMAANEAEATDALNAFTPSLLIMDLRIDGELQGVDIANRLARAITPAPKTVVITGDTAADTLTLLRESGFSWLIKPVDPTLLAQTASGVLSST
jgi:signal transduction histidine kinase